MTRGRRTGRAVAGTRRRRARWVVLWERERSAMAGSWRNRIEARRRPNGFVILRMRHLPFCRADGPPWEPYRSRPFRRAATFLKAVDAAAGSQCLDLYDEDLERIVAAVAAVDADLARAAQRLRQPDDDADETEGTPAAARAGKILRYCPMTVDMVKAAWKTGREPDGHIAEAVERSRREFRRYAQAVTAARFGGQRLTDDSRPNDRLHTVGPPAPELEPGVQTAAGAESRGHHGSATDPTRAERDSGSGRHPEAFVRHRARFAEVARTPSLGSWWPVPSEAELARVFASDRAQFAWRRLAPSLVQ